MTGETTILLVDDHAVVREGYRSLLQKQQNLRVSAEAEDGESAYRAFKHCRPDLVIMDLSMPGAGGIETIRRIRQWDRQARVLVFTMHQKASYAVQAVRAGARGYVTKSSAPAYLLRAVAEVMQGRVALSPDIGAELALQSVSKTQRVAERLSPREFEILRLLLAEKTAEDIASALHLSAKTVANTHYLIKSKLGVASDIGLVLLAAREGLLDEPLAARC